VPVFVVQKHAATSLHYDFRLEVDGAMRSWAVPRGPSTDPGERRLAMAVEDHPMSWNSFEGVIGPGYGAGTVIVWDEGEYRNTTERDGESVPMAEALADGYARFFLEGRKLRGEWSLRRMSGAGNEKSWLLTKRRDEYADAERDPVRDEPESVVSGLTIEDVAERG
jgi:DNA ligase D-like protein (predicted 3'-phosphoesterase)